MKPQESVIAISGTPGVGKTAVAKELARKLNAIYLNLSNVVIEKKLYSEYDAERGTYVVDEEKLKKYIRNLAEQARQLIVIDSHYGEVIDDDLIIKIFVLRLDPRELFKRLKERLWPLPKIIENVESELLGICTANALSEHPSSKVCEVDVTNKSVNAVVREILDILHNRGECRVYVNWLLDDVLVSEILSFLTSE
ncbi:MAG: adenylate kinase family protein [Desulfurococcales archaeon]|nr:adenylate kinase family protein [Desulfurococcales archaeon]